MIMKRDHTPLPPPPPPIVHSKPKTDAELKGALNIRKRKFQIISLFLLFGPCASIIVWISPFEILSFILVASYLLFTIVFSFRHGLPLCPRCNKSYYHKGGFTTPLTSKCLNCGLSIRKEDVILDFKNNT
jgi:hypothetical protein